MVRRIEFEWPGDNNAWKEKISKKRRDEIEQKISEVQAADGYVSDIALSQFADKATVICKARLIGGSRKSIKERFDSARDLRDDLAHANYYADTPAQAKSVCEVVRTILAIKSELLNAIKAPAATGGHAS